MEQGERGTPLARRTASQPLRREVGGRRPAASDVVHLPRERAAVTEHTSQQDRCLHRAESQHRSVQLQHLPLTAQSLDRERWPDP